MNPESQDVRIGNHSRRAHHTLILRIRNHKKRAYGLVVFNDDLTRAIKLFHRGQQEHQATRVFEAEVEAYEIAINHSDLMRYVPSFYGKVTVDQVIDKNNFDISSEYYCHLAYEMSFVSGRFFDIKNAFSSDHSDLAKLFDQAGIKHLSDVSATFDECGEIKKIVDFATNYPEPWHDPMHKL